VAPPEASADELPVLEATPEDVAVRSNMAARIDAALADPEEVEPLPPVALAAAEPAPSLPAKSLAPPALPPTPFDAVEGLDVDGMLQPEPEAVLEGESFEEAVLEPEPEPFTAEPEKEPALELSTPEPEKAPVQEPIELSPEPESKPEPVKAEAQEFIELSPEPEPEPQPEAKLKPESEPEPLTAEPELEPLTAEPEPEPLTAEPEPEEARAEEPSTPEPQKTPPRDETTESGVWALDGSQAKAREVEEPAPPPEPVAEAKPRQPLDLGELPPEPEEPMQLAATWEFMGMAEAHGSAAAPVSEERGMDLESTGAASVEEAGSPGDEVALASTWDFVPQWQPGAPAGPSAPAPSAPVAEKPAAAPVSPEAPVNPVTTAKFGIGTAQSPEAPVNPVTTAKFGIGTGEPAAEPAEASWDQMFPAEEPKAPAPAEEADPFTEFATEAARKRNEKPPAANGNEGSGS
jgi:hypothetical protein